MAERPTGIARRVAWSATLTVVSLTMFETLAQLGGWLPEPVALLALIVVSCAFVGGTQGGLASAALCVVFAIFAAPFRSVMFPADAQHFGRATIAAYALPALALLVGSLRIQAQNRLSRYVSAREEADTAEQRYRELIEGLGGVFWQVGLPERRVEVISPGARDMFGYPVGYWIDSDALWTSLVHPEDRELVWEAFDTIARTRRPTEVEHRVIRADGSVLPVRTAVQPHIDEEGVLRGLRGATLATADSGPADIARAVFDHLPDPVLVHDAESRIVDANPAACASLGYLHGELIGLRLADIGFDQDEAGTGAARAVLRRKDGERLSAVVRLCPLPNAGRTLTIVQAARIAAA